MRQLLCTFFLFAFSICQAGINVWTNFGPEGGQGGNILTHPEDSMRLFAVGAGRVFRSDDAGDTWRPVMNGLPIGRTQIVIANAKSNIDRVYAFVQSESSVRVQGVFRTDNGGLRWRKLSYITPIGATIVDLSVDPSNPDQIVLVNSQAGSLAIALSNDAGQNFTSPSAANYAPASFTTMSATRFGNVVYAATRASNTSGPSIYRSTNSGASFSITSSQPIAPASIVRIRTAPNSSAIIYGTAEVFPVTCGIDPCNDGFRSDNSGATWNALPQLVYPPWLGPLNNSTLLQPTSDLVRSSSDSGAIFSTRLSVTDGYFYNVAGDPNYPTVARFYTSSYTDGLARTNNNGISRIPINFGFQATPALSLAIANPSTTSYRLYAGHDTEALSNSISGRNLSDILAPEEWVALPTRSTDSSGVGAIVVDPLSPARVFAGSTSPSLMRSFNAGAGWTSSPLFAGASDVQAILLDPRSCVSPPPSGPCITGNLAKIIVGGTENSTVALGASTNALQMSGNSGASFSSAIGIPRPQVSGLRLRVTSLAMSGVNASAIYAGTALIGTAAPGASANGIFKSTNGGTTWGVLTSTSLPTLPGGGASTKLNVGAIKTEFNNDSVIYAGLYENLLAPGVNSGLYRSVDGGSTWLRIALARRTIRDILVSRNGLVILVATSGSAAGQGGVVRSVDGGATFHAISTGMPPAGAIALAARGQQLFAATPTGVYAFFQGLDNDLDNVPTATEDAAPNAGDLNLDGTLDSAQNNVASFIIKTINGEGSAETTANKASRGRTNYGDVETDTTLVRGGTACQQINNAYGIDPEIYPQDLHPSGIAYDASDLGLVNIELSNCVNAVVRVRFDDGAFTDPVNWSWRNYGPLIPGADDSLAWSAFPAALQLNSTTWQLTLNANQFGAYRADPNSILLRGGPAFFPERMLTNGFE